MATLQTEPLAAADPATPDPAAIAAALRAEINRQNSQHSTGPVSPEGKEAVRLNALKTGLYAKTVVLPHEDRAAYDIIGADIAETYNPQTPIEKRVAQAIQDTEWRIERVISIETNLHLIVGVQQLGAIQTQFAIDDPIDSLCLGQVRGYLLNSRAFDQLNKHEARLRRLHDKQVRQLCLLIANRPAPAPEPGPPAGFVSPIPPQPPPAAARSGSVSPESETAPPAPAKSSLLDGVPQRILDNMPNFVGKTAEMHQAQWLKKHWNRR